MKTGKKTNKQKPQAFWGQGGQDLKSMQSLPQLFVCFLLKKILFKSCLFVRIEKKHPLKGCIGEIDRNYVKGLGKVFLKKSAVSSETLVKHRLVRGYLHQNEE